MNWDGNGCGTQHQGPATGTRQPATGYQWNLRPVLPLVRYLWPATASCVPRVRTPRAKDRGTRIRATRGRPSLLRVPTGGFAATDLATPLLMS